MASTLQIEERFSVNAPVERVWPFLLDPEQIVVCLPGAQLTEVEDERTFHGNMKVKVGPVTVSYKGTMEMTEVDEAARLIRMEGKGKEKGGAGTAKMSMVVRVEPADNGCEVVVEADAQLAGKIVRFGRGMIKNVSKQLFKQFSACVQETMAAAEAVDEAAAPPSPALPPQARGEGAAAQGEAEATSPAPGGGRDQGRGESATPTPDSSTDSEPKAIRKIAPREVKPVRALPLIFRAMWDGIVGFFARLFGRKRRD